jgi:hypothetical protein
MSSAINQPVYQAKSQNIFNADGVTPIYNSATGDWTLKNASGVSVFTALGTGAVTLGLASVNSYASVQGASEPQLRLTAAAGTVTNWRLITNNTVSEAFELQASSTAGGATFSTQVITATKTGAVTLGPASGGVRHTINGGLVLPKTLLLQTTTNSLNVANYSTIDNNGLAADAICNGFAGGVEGQRVVVVIRDSSKIITFTHNNGSGTQPFLLAAGASTLVLNSGRSGFEAKEFYCTGNYWIPLY